MSNEQNIEPYKLKPNSERTSQIARMGGKASGEARRRNKAIRDLLETMLYSTAKGEMAEIAMSVGEDLDPDDINNATAILGGQIIAAANGNANSAKFIMDIVGAGGSSEIDEDELSKSLRELGESL